MVEQRGVDQIIQEWPGDSRKVARQVIDKYGAPDEATKRRLVWHGNGPWKRTVMHRDPVEHRFPKPHNDLLEQSVNYRVPPEKGTDLLRFDGSVTVQRTRGELRAMCHDEGANYLAINLANDIIEGTKSVEEARRAYAENVKQRGERGEPTELMRGFSFELPQGATNDPDEAVLEAPAR